MQRIATRTLSPILRFIPHRHDRDVRPYSSGDLARCAQLLQKTSAGFEWALLWSPNQLANQLESPASGTLVLDRDGRVQGMVNYHYLSLQGRVPVRAALIDLWAEDDLTSAQRVRLLGHLCNELRGRDVHVVLALRSTMMPAAAFVANVFLPQQHGYLCVLSRGAGTGLSPPKTWSLLMR